MSFDLTDYVFELPEQQIAQKPLPERDASRLLVAGPAGPPEHRHFRELTQYLGPGDVLVLNQTKVINARCYAYKDTGGKVEIFILGMHVNPSEVPVLLKPAKKIKPGMVLHFPLADVRVTVKEKAVDGKAVLAFVGYRDLGAVMAKDGQVPLPPYIQRKEGPGEDDTERYQTVFARDPGAVAAPTAGLHFTPGLLEQLKAGGTEIHYITHHVGAGTFKPVTAEDIRDHKMEIESYHIEEAVAHALNQAKAAGKRIIAVGTTSTRCLESSFGQEGFKAGAYDTGLYIYPGYQFKAIDALITNFHLPGSSLLLLVSAMMGRRRILDLYHEAVAEGYRFYSYGDAMLLLPQRTAAEPNGA